MHLGVTKTPNLLLFVNLLLTGRWLIDCKTKTLPFTVHLPSFHPPPPPPKIALHHQEQKPSISFFLKARLTFVHSSEKLGFVLNQKLVEHPSFLTMWEQLHLCDCHLLCMPGDGVLIVVTCAVGCPCAQLQKPCPGTHQPPCEFLTWSYPNHTSDISNNAWYANWSC